MRVYIWLAFIIALAAACDDAIEVTQHPDLLLPWSQVTGRITYATPSQLKLIDGERRDVRAFRDALAGELFVDLSSSFTHDEVAVGILRTDGTNRIGVVDFDGTESRSVDRATCGRWLPDGRLSYMRGDTVLIEGVPLSVMTPQRWSCPTWSPDGTYFLISLADTVRRSRVYRIRVENPTPEPATLTAIGGPRTSWDDPAISPGGQTFAVIYASDDPLTEILLANTSGGIIRKLGEATRLFGLSWSPDASQVLAVSTVSTAGGLFIIRVSDGAIRKLVNHPVYAASWGP